MKLRRHNNWLTWIQDDLNKPNHNLEVEIICNTLIVHNPENEFFPMIQTRDPADLMTTVQEISRLAIGYYPDGREQHRGDPVPITQILLPAPRLSARLDPPHRVPILEQRLTDGWGITISYWWMIGGTITRPRTYVEVAVVEQDGYKKVTTALFLLDEELRALTYETDGKWLIGVNHEHPGQD